jgi:proteic killer suppression protein
VIKSFADGETEQIWNGRRSRRLPFDIQPLALRKLRMLNQARASPICGSHPATALRR